jgi:hypothetical protein
MKNLNSSLWRSNDFYLSACVLASGASLIGLTKGNNNFVTFLFSISKEKAEKIIQNHWDRKLKIPTRDLVEAINELKTRLHSGV